MSNLIFGCSWEAIQRAQQGGRLHERLAIAAPEIVWSDSDKALLAKYVTLCALEAAGFHGVADRARRLGKAER